MAVNTSVDRDPPLTSPRARIRVGWPDVLLTAAAMIVVAVAHVAGGRGGTLIDVVVTAFLVPLVLIDLRIRRLPDLLTLGGAAVIVALLVAQAMFRGEFGSLGHAAAGGAVMAGLLLALHLVSPSGMGFGDVKLGLLLGVVIGSRSLQLVITALLVAGVAGALVGVVLMVRHRRRRVTLPFGPCLVLGSVVALVLGAG